MTDAPARIWACMEGPMVGLFVSGGVNMGWPEYIRADLIPAIRDDARRQALEEAMRACLEERGEPLRFFDDARAESWFDSAQACADAIGVMLAEGENG